MWENRGEYFARKREKLTTQYSAPSIPALTHVSATVDTTSLSSALDPKGLQETIAPHTALGDSPFGNNIRLLSGITAFVSPGLFYQLPETTKISDTWFLSRLDNREVSRLLSTFGGILSHDIDAGISHFICTEIPVWLLRRNRDVNVTNIKYKLVHPKWLLDSIVSGKIQNTENYRLSGDVNRTTLESLYPQRQVAGSDILPPSKLKEKKPNFSKTGSGDKGSGSRMLSAEENPNFVRDYFGNSRLHHLSSWKAKFQETIAQYLLQQGSSQALVQRIPRIDNVDLDSRFVVHLDMDAFFITVTLKYHPEFADKPCVVAHGGDHSDISSSNYLARQRGIRNGMWLGDAKRTCPELQVLPYMFEAYEETSKQVFSIIVRYTKLIQVKSCDEALLDMTHYKSLERVQSAVAEIRKEVLELTGCVCSAGIAPNILLARLALKKAKPNGVACSPFLGPSTSREDMTKWICQFNLDDLPSIGWGTLRSLQEANIADLTSLQNQTRDALVRLLGKMTGNRLYEYCRGIDSRAVEVVKQRKSIAVELNYGIRFTKSENLAKFVFDIAEEVQRRLLQSKVRGRKLTLSVMRRKPEEKEAMKFMGHGLCDTFSRSGNLDSATDEAAVISDFAWDLYKKIGCPPNELRGIGIHISDLETDLGARLDRKRKREGPITPSQQTLSKVLFGKPASKEPVNRTELPGASKIARSVATSPRKAQRKQNEESEEEDDVLDMEGLGGADLSQERVPRIPPKSANIRKPPEIDDKILQEQMSMVQAAEKFVFLNIPRFEDFEDSLLSAIASAKELTNIHLEYFQQLIYQWIMDWNLEDVSLFLRFFQSLEFIPKLFYNALVLFADGIVRSVYGSRLVF